LVTETVGVAPVVSAPTITREVVSEPEGDELAIGSRLPATVPVYAMPFLIDPTTNVIVDELM
jgi:hypothetical protein